MPMMTFGSKDPDEIDVFGFDFSARLDAAETINSVTFHVAVIDGQDANAASMLLGVPTIQGARVLQKIGGGVAGVIYRISAHITTSAGRTLVEGGPLAVKELG